MMTDNSLVTRRQMLSVTGAAMLSTSRLAHAATSAHQLSPGVRFAVRSPQKGKTLPEQAAILKRLGYQGIELGPEWLEVSPDEIRNQLAPHGIQVSAIVGSLQLLNTDPAERMKAVELDIRLLHKAKALGASGLIEVPVFGPNRFPPDPSMTPIELENRLLVAGLKQLAATAAETDVNVLIEPLAGRYTHFLTRQTHGLEIIQAVGAPGFKLLTDFYHMQFEEKDIPETLTRCAKHVGYLHFAEGPKRLVPGSDRADYRPAFRILKKAGYCGWLTIEAVSAGDVEKELSSALGYLKDQWDSA